MYSFYLPLREMLIPKKVQMPRDIVRDATTVKEAVIPRPTLDFTRSNLPKCVTIIMTLNTETIYTMIIMVPQTKDIIIVSKHNGLGKRPYTPT